MCELFDMIHRIMNYVKGFTVGYNIQEEKMLIDFNGKRYVAEFREVKNPADDPWQDMKRIKYL